MTLDPKIAHDTQQLDVGEYVVLFDLDCTPIGGSVYHFCPTTITDSTSQQSTTVVYNGVSYLPIDVKLEGFEITSDGQQPRPKITVANVNLTFASLVTSLNDLVGAQLTRRRTFKKYLDGEIDADPTAQFPVDIYIIERKTIQNKFQIQWELSSFLDLSGRYIPARQILRDTCTHRYRIYIGGAFVYTNVTCPYTGVNYFDEDGNVVVDPADDVCGRRLSDCDLRYPLDSDELPTRAFPGVAVAGAPWRV
jgi:lambda family phage minor tail protein L